MNHRCQTVSVRASEHTGLLAPLRTLTRTLRQQGLLLRSNSDGIRDQRSNYGRKVFTCQMSN